MIEVSEIADRLNERAASLAPDLLPNGRKAGGKWMFSGIDDTGQSESAWVNLTGSRIGHWQDFGGCRAGEEKGDMLDLLALKRFAGDSKAAIGEAKRILGIVDDFNPEYRPDRAEIERRAADARARAEAREAEEAAEREGKARGARSLWLAARPIAGTPAEAYLRARELAPNAAGEWPGSFRFHPEVWVQAEKVKAPALLCSIVSPAGVQIGTHRIYLGRQGGVWGKRAMPRPKMVLGNMWGGFIPINKGASGKSMREMPEGEPVYLTEGPEDAVVVRMMKPDARIGCAISLPNVGGIVLPAAGTRLVVVADRDQKEAAQDSLERAIALQQARGVHVQLVMPPPGTKDMNEWLQAHLRALPPGGCLSAGDRRRV